DGLPSNVVMRVKRDTLHDVIWIVSSSAIAYMTPDHRVTTVQKFPYTNNFDLYENSQGDMWVLSSNGIYVAPTVELLANGEINPVYYSLASGLPCIATANSYSELTPEGDLYISGSSGVCKVNIDQSFDIVNDLKAAVPYVQADGAPIYPDENGAFTIPASTQKLTVPSFVFNYTLSDPLVSYRLEGFERQSATVRRSDMVPIDYTNLRGGTYHFVMRLMAAMDGGYKEISVQITKEKAFYEEVWFYIVSGIALLVLLAMIGGVYSRKKTRELERKKQEEIVLVREQMEQENRLREQKRVEEELRMARELQMSALPMEFPPFPDREEFCLYASMTPAKEVGGDFYDFFLVDEDHLGLIMADVSGKGIPAALFMMACKIILQSCAMLGNSASEILTKTNEAICSNNPEEMFITVWLGILEISTGKLTAANAGHEYPVLKRADGGFELFRDKHGFVAGSMEGIRYQEYELQLCPGDKLFVYTDGVREARDADGKQFGTERMLAALNESRDAEPEKILKSVRRAVDAFVKDAEQFDDLTMLCMEYRGKGSI
ncbi:MAG: PP2C family protein-serine/threonine phosphatase, partial [Clostridia bacterium]|nr:PP2C family protein-serine/threonine phosphatase [Clostridia bacterium]